MNPMTTTDGQVDQIIGSAYQVIKYVASNMEYLISLAESIDPLVNSMQTAFEALRRTYKEAGYELLKATFKTGAAIGTGSQVLIDDTTGIAYSWGGALPKFVPENSSIASTGGVGSSAWVPQDSSSLREVLLSANGVSMVGGAASLSELAALSTKVDQVSTAFSAELDQVSTESNTGIYESLRRSYAEVGYNLENGSFELGGILTSRASVLLHRASAKAYSGTGPFPQTVSINTNPAIGGYVDRSGVLSRKDTVHPKDHGAVADGIYHPLSERYSTLVAANAVYPHVTALTQSIDWAALQSALNTGAGTVDIRGGKYFVNSDLSRTTDINLIGDKSSKIIMVGSRFIMEGSLAALPDLSTNVTTLSRSLTFSSAPSISPGDTVLLFNPTDYSWSQHRSYYRAGEFFKVHSLSGNVASIYGLPSDPYLASAVDMYRVDGISVTLEDVYIEGDAVFADSPMAIRFGVDVDIKGWRGSVSQAYQLEIDRCYCVNISAGSAVNNSPYVGDEYGIIISNSSNVTVNFGNHFATRHSIALGGGAGVGAIPCRNIKIIGANLMNSGADIGASDIHGNCDNVQYVNCEVGTHANMAGRDVKYINCRIHQRTSPADGCCIYGSEIVGGTYEILDCELITQGDLDSFGAINLTMAIQLKQDLTVKVRNLTVRGGNGGANAKLVRIGTASGESKKVSVDIRGVRCELTSVMAVLFIRCDDSPSHAIPSYGHIVDDIYGPAGMALIFDTGPAILGVPTRQMQQQGVVDTITSVSTAAIATAAAFRYKYSKMPTATVGVSSPNGAAISTIGGQPASPIIYSLSESQVRAGIVAPANMTAGTPVRLHWFAGIAEI